MDSTLSNMVSSVYSTMTSWWNQYKGAIFESMDAHRMVWVYAIGFISIVGLFVLGGSLIKNGVIFGLLLTASLVLLFMHGGKGSMEKKTKVALWISKHCAVADWLLAIICGFVFVSAGVTPALQCQWYLFLLLYYSIILRYGVRVLKSLTKYRISPVV